MSLLSLSLLVGCSAAERANTGPQVYWSDVAPEATSQCIEEVQTNNPTVDPDKVSEICQCAVQAVQQPGTGMSASQFLSGGQQSLAQYDQIIQNCGNQVVGIPLSLNSTLVTRVPQGEPISNPIAKQRLLEMMRSRAKAIKIHDEAKDSPAAQGATKPADGTTPADGTPPDPAKPAVAPRPAPPKVSPVYVEIKDADKKVTVLDPGKWICSLQKNPQTGDEALSLSFSWPKSKVSLSIFIQNRGAVRPNYTLVGNGGDLQKDGYSAEVNYKNGIGTADQKIYGLKNGPRNADTCGLEVSDLEVNPTENTVSGRINELVLYRIKPALAPGSFPPPIKITKGRFQCPIGPAPVRPAPPAVAPAAPAGKPVPASDGGIEL